MRLLLLLKLFIIFIHYLLFIHNYFNLGKTLGKGTFGQVKLATKILTGEKFAVKMLDK